jgi:tripartite-type tricarboxylate transporter receptor subunit TctC
MVKKGTSDEIMDAIAKAAKAVIDSEAYQKYIKKQPHVIPMFEDDRGAITSNFKQSLKDAKVFMKDNGII